uniref:Uncharacterized protein n=1 Tax=Magallana gigas TaxID=29159 RepID=A0A8W8JS47_MAGGI
MEGLERFLRDIDEDLVCYKEEFIKLAVKSDSTLKYLRPHEVESMNIPPVYKRMLIDRKVNLQTPLHKKDELNDIKHKPNLPSAISIPGNPISKSSCDNCHRKGHRSIMNQGNKSCPFMKCEGYHACGQEGKHPGHKHQ